MHYRVALRLYLTEKNKTSPCNPEDIHLIYVPFPYLCRIQTQIQTQRHQAVFCNLLWQLFIIQSLVLTKMFKPLSLKASETFEESELCVYLSACLFVLRNVCVCLSVCV